MPWPLKNGAFWVSLKPTLDRIDSASWSLLNSMLQFGLARISPKGRVTGSSTGQQLNLGCFRWIFQAKLCRIVQISCRFSISCRPFSCRILRSCAHRPGGSQGSTGQKPGPGIACHTRPRRSSESNGALGEFWGLIRKRMAQGDAMRGKPLRP